jgi:hypothetical protein
VVNPLNGDRWVLHSGTFSRLWRQKGGNGTFEQVSTGVLGNNPNKLALDWKNEEIWVADSTDDQVICINYAGVQVRFVSGGNAVDINDIAFDVENELLFVSSGVPGSADIYVTARGSNALTDAAEFINNQQARAITFDQSAGILYTVAGSARSVTSMPGAGLGGRAGQVVVGGNAQAPAGVVFNAIAIDEETKDLYAADLTTGDIWVNAGAVSPTWVQTVRNVGFGVLQASGLWFSERDGSLYQSLLTTSPASSAGRLDVNQGVALNSGVKSYIKT